MNIAQALIDAPPLMLSCVGLAFLWSLLTCSRLSLVLVSSVSSATLFALLFLIWFFRDGLGPDAVTSTGLEAARRIGVGAAVPVGVWLLVNGIAFARFRLRHARAV
jgi:hypothetical protein